MNAHHKKASYRPPPPVDRRSYSAGHINLAHAAPHKGIDKLCRAVERVPFGWQLDAIVPHTGADTAVVVDAIKDLANACGTGYLATNVNLAELLEVEFLNSYVRTGNLVALSLEDGEDADIVCLDGRGRLILSVTKDTYESLGLPGRASAFGSHRQRYVIELDLRAPGFRAGKPGFERIKKALADWPAAVDLLLLDELGGQPARREPRRFDLLLSYVDEKGEAQPVRFSNSPVSCSPIPTTLNAYTLSNIAVPLSTSFPSPPSASSAEATQQKRRRLSSGSFRLARGAPTDPADPAHFWEEYREWAGLVSLGENAAVRTLRWREGEQEEQEGWGVARELCGQGDVSVVSATGFFHPKTLAEQIQRLARSEALAQVPFASFSLRPFSHSPISHTSAADPPVVGTSQKPNGKKRKRGRGRGEEEEADPTRLADEGGWDLVLRRTGEGVLEWHLWEMR
ncbi:hypothetical protein JCM10908_004660 [Rhodotorula pacifica]|uniref:uncharacterized protein n=1 Tax=Rhodotorula pacifica TaxID=1495444 RepID=UPI00316AF2D2